jgi:alanine racemase
MSRAWIEIDHDALVHNLGVLRSLAGPGKGVIAVVKANAYGHGDLEVARTLVSAGVERLAVATTSEAARLRDGELSGPILLLWGFDNRDVTEVVRLGLEPVVDRLDTVSKLDDAAAAARRPVAVHLKIDTGLQRQGATPDDALEIAAAVEASSSLTLAGTMTHLAAPGENQAFSEEQLAALGRVLDALAGLGVNPGLVHVSATGGVLAGIGSFADAIRPGLGLYGLVPAWAEPPFGRANGAPGADFRPVLSLHARPVRVHDVPAGTPVGYGLRWTANRASRLATLPIGYGDGWPRIHVNNGLALVHGRRVPMVGAISMDGLVVDVTDVNDVRPDDEFVLIGSQGDERITVAEVAEQRRTISYEVTTALRERLPRVHRHLQGAAS